MSGTTKSRERAGADDLLALPILLPPLADQQRIVDLIAAVDAAIEAAERDQERSRGLLGAVLTEWNEAWAGPMMRLGDLAEIGSGPSWSSKEEYAEQVLGGARVLGITNTPSPGEVDLSDVKYVTGLPPSTRRLGSGSLLMIRTNGNRSRIGNVYRVPAEAHGAAFSAFQIGITLSDAANANFSYWVLAEPNLQRRISGEASGSTGLGNVAVKWLRELLVPWPEGDERRSISALFNAVDAHSRQCREVLTRFQHLRSALLSDLLSGNHEVPDSYDELLSA
jgi:type I restriction enzyme S subunit